MANKQQVFSEQSVDFGNQMKFSWLAFAGDNTVVPASKKLDVTSLTLSYFPGPGGIVGRADITGRESGNAVWRLQSVFVSPHNTVHLTFPGGLTLLEGGHVEVSFFTNGPGTIFVSANGKLVSL